MPLILKILLALQVLLLILQMVLLELSEGLRLHAQVNKIFNLIFLKQNFITILSPQPLGNRSNLI